MNKITWSFILNLYVCMLLFNLGTNLMLWPSSLKNCTYDCMKFFPIIFSKSIFSRQFFPKLFFRKSKIPNINNSQKKLLKKKEGHDKVTWGVAFKIPSDDVEAKRAYLDHREKVCMITLNTLSISITH